MLQVVANDLDPKYAYIQVTFVTPYFDDHDREDRVTMFERNNNIKRFMYETPFTKDGKSQGSTSEQWKRRTVLTSKCGVHEHQHFQLLLRYTMFLLDAESSAFC